MWNLIRKTKLWFQYIPYNGLSVLNEEGNLVEADQKDVEDLADTFNI